MRTGAAVCGKVLLAMLWLLVVGTTARAADVATYLYSFGDGPPHIRWLTLSEDDGVIALSDSDLVRRYRLDGTPLERLSYRSMHMQQVVSAVSGQQGDIYLLWYQTFDDDPSREAAALVRMDALGSIVRMVGGEGEEPGKFREAKDIASCPDGSIVVAELGNDRLQRFGADLDFLQAWPTPSEITEGGFSGPYAVAADAANHVWACYLGPVSRFEPVQVAVVIYDAHGAQVGEFLCEISLENALDPGDVLKDIGVDDAGQLHMLCATGWNKHEFLTFDGSGNEVGSFLAPEWTRGACFAKSGSAVCYGHMDGVQIFSAGGEPRYRWGDLAWGMANHLPLSPRDVAFDAEGWILVSGGDFSEFPPACVYLHRYTATGALDEILFSSTGSEAADWFFAVAPDGTVIRCETPIAIDRNGNRYYLSHAGDRVIKTDPEGESLEEWELGASISAIAIGLDDLFYALRDWKVEVRDLDGALLRSWKPYGAGKSIVADPRGRVCVGTGTEVSWYSPEGVFLDSIGYGGFEPVQASAIALSEEGGLAIADEWRSRIHVCQMARSRYSDIPWWHWAKDQIEALAEAEVVQGYPDGRYCPETSVSRDQMAAYLSRALAGGDVQVPEGPAEASFPDVSAEHWAYKYVEYAAAAGVVGGYPDGLYHPAEVVKRAQMAVFIARAVAGSDSAVPQPPRQPTFADVRNNARWEWCYKHVEYLAAEGIVSGYPGGVYEPLWPVSREQMAVYVARGFGLAE